MNLKNDNKRYAYLLVLAMLLWGGGWTALKILTQTMPMDVILFWRFFLMSLSFLPIIYYFKTTITLTRGSLKYIIFSAILNIAFMVFSFLGIKEGLAGAGSVIITTFSPIMTFLLVAILFKSKRSTRQYFGLLLGLIGGYILLQLNNFSLFLHGPNIYFLICALIWAGVTLLSQHVQKHIHPVHYSFFISLIATLFSFFYAYNANLSAVFTQDARFWIALIYLAVLGQTVATTIFFIASGKLGSQKTSSFMFLVPFFALFSAWIILDEPLQLHIIIGGFISMLAVYFINKQHN